MAQQNYVSATLSQEDLDAVKVALNTMEEHLPFLIQLEPGERREIPNYGPGSRDFVRNAGIVTKESPDILPRKFDIEEFQRDVELYDKLYELKITAGKLYSKLEDTLAGVGSDAMVAALEVYAALKRENSSELQDILHKMSLRFRRSNSAAGTATEE